LYSKDLISHLKNYPCVYWDWNGTLLDDVDICVEITNNFLTSKEAPSITKDFYLKNFTIPVVDYYKSLEIEKYGITFEEMTHHFVTGYENSRPKQILYKGVVDTVKELHEIGVKQVILSAAHQEELKYQLVKNNLDEYIFEVSGATDYSAGCKLERGLSLFKKHGPGIMVGDTGHDIEIGKKMGLETVWVSEGHQCQTKVEGLDCLDYIYDRKKGEISKSTS